MVLKNRRKQKKLPTSSKVDGAVEEDKISKLPDVLIHHILSFLPAKPAMSTCILSKRWKHVVSSYPILDFREYRGTYVTIAELEAERLKTNRLMNFLDTVLYLHEKPNIQKFGLSWDDLFDGSRLSKWIATVIKHRVEELFLSGGSGTSFVFPQSFFTCDSLTVLDLEFIKLNVPNKVSFPRLKSLQLTGVEFMNGISIEKLIFNCPILEVLAFTHCHCLCASEVLCIANTALKNLYISDNYCFESSTLKISAPNLSTIRYGQSEPGDFIVDSFPSLVQADINMCVAARASVLIKLLQKLSTIKSLTMCGACFLVINEADILSLPYFDNLIHIEVSSDFRYYGSESLDSVSTLRRFFEFLSYSPNVKSIVFAQSTRIYEEEDDNDWSLSPYGSPPKLKSLKSLKFMDFQGVRPELNVIKLFLKYARFLETVTVVPSDEFSEDHERLINVMQQLLMFPKPENCVVKFMRSSEKA
ncbi:hypothetical protein MKX03_029549 [Papaver bracteatum]|nr:hypothetical protein MKX03_029549 [Papaver bracteatum]